MSKSGIVNVRMVITEEKILSNIDKIQKLINPKSKKQIVQLEEDTYFKDLIESVKTYLLEYPKKKNFPSRQREQNIALAGDLKELLDLAIEKDPEWPMRVQEAETKFGEDILNTIKVVGCSQDNLSEDSPLYPLHQNQIYRNSRFSQITDPLHF